MASQSTISKANCYGVILALANVNSESLYKGHIFRIDNLVSFQIILQGLPADTLDELDKTNSKGAKIIYKSSGYMKRNLGQLIYKKLI